jgi:hypothetical protein
MVPNRFRSMIADEKSLLFLHLFIKYKNSFASFEKKKVKIYLCKSWFSSKKDLLPQDSCRKSLSAGFKIKQRVFHGKFNH